MGFGAVQVPAWALIVCAIFVVVLLAIIGYLLRAVLRANERRALGIEAQLTKLQEKQEALDADLNRKHGLLEAAVGKSDDERNGHAASIDKRFVEIELSHTRMFVDRNTWTRDYVTLTQRIDVLHRRIDRREEKR